MIIPMESKLKSNRFFFLSKVSTYCHFYAFPADVAIVAWYTPAFFQLPYFQSLFLLLHPYSTEVTDNPFPSHKINHVWFPTSLVVSFQCCSNSEAIPICCDSSIELYTQFLSIFRWRLCSCQVSLKHGPAFQYCLDTNADIFDTPLM